MARVHLPPRGDLESPADFYLLDKGRHNTLLLPTSTPGVYAQYGYGDWEYYAKSRTGLFASLAALFFPTQGTLGRGVLEHSGPGPAPGRVPGGVVGVERLHAEAQAIERLRNRLDSAFEENEESLRRRERIGMSFVRHPENYWLFHHSHSMIREWLVSLGLDVRGRTAIVTNWEVVAPERR